MVDQKRHPQKNDEEWNRDLELLYFAYRAFIAKPDARLHELGFSRVHHRILYFVGRNPGISMNELLAILGVSKQYLHRPLRQLMEKRYLGAKADPQDRRVRRLTLTAKGSRLEQELSGEQRRRFARVFAELGPEANAAWREAMQLLADQRFDE